MRKLNTLVCPYCHNHFFQVKYESTFVYSYVVDSDAPGLKNTDEFLSFKYDKREQKESKQYVECQCCGAEFPCSLNWWDNKQGVKELQDMIDSQI